MISEHYTNKVIGLTLIPVRSLPDVRNRAYRLPFANRDPEPDLMVVPHRVEVIHHLKPWGSPHVIYATEVNLIIKVEGWLVMEILAYLHNLILPEGYTDIPSERRYT